MKKTMLIAVIAAMLGCGTALAGVIDIGDPQPANSWYQEWSENGILRGDFLPYNRVVITVTEGEGLEFLTAITEDWVVDGNTMYYTGATGSQIGQFDFITTFYGHWTDEATFSYQVYMDDDPLSDQLIDWDPATETWSFKFPNNCVLPTDPPVQVPEPSLILLLGIGYGGITLVARHVKP